MWNQIRSISKIIKPILQINFQQTTRNFSILSSMINKQYAILGSNASSNKLESSSILLQPAITSINIERGLKQMGNCKRRCKDCYFVVRHERLFVMCKTHPRHKQMAMKKRPRSTWLLTDATQSEKRAW